jgi:hypothetical protein
MYMNMDVDIFTNMNMNMAMNGGKDIKMNLSHEHVHE